MVVAESVPAADNDVPAVTVLLCCCYAAVPAVVPAADSVAPAEGAAVAGEFVRCCC
ncbi:hypothetical protein SOVF_140460 [Spinacia oleracea]|nr:hypothetical protein SOVF_140460 [Spinacia oleracea]